MTKRNISKSEIERRKKYRKRIFLILALSGSLYIFVPLLLGDMGILKYFTMLKTEHQISHEIQVLIHDNEQLQKNVDLLKSDPLTIERIARQQLGLVKKGEIVYRFSTQGPQ